MRNPAFDLGDNQFGAHAIDDTATTTAAEAQQRFLIEVQDTRGDGPPRQERPIQDVLISVPADADILSRLSRRIDLRISYKQASDTDLNRVSGMQNVIYMDLDRTGVSDQGLKNLEGLSRLQYLNLRLTDVADSGMKSIAKLANLTELHLSGTSVTEKGVSELKALSKLATLSIGTDSVADATIKAAAALPALESLSLVGTVTEAGLGHLQTAQKLEDIALLKPGLTKEQLERASAKLGAVEIITTDGIAIDTYKNGKRTSHVVPADKPPESQPSQATPVEQSAEVPLGTGQLPPRPDDLMRTIKDILGIPDLNNPPSPLNQTWPR